MTRLAPPLMVGQSAPIAELLDHPPMRLVVGLKWDPATAPSTLGRLLGRQPERRDLDLSCMVISEGRFLREIISGKKTESRDHALSHTGDDTTGTGAGDDERITLELGRIDGSVEELIICVTSGSGQPLREFGRASVHLFDPKTRILLARTFLNECARGSHAHILCHLWRESGRGWFLETVAEDVPVHTPQELVERALAL